MTHTHTLLTRSLTSKEMVSVLVEVDHYDHSKVKIDTCNILKHVSHNLKEELL